MDQDFKNENNLSAFEQAATKDNTDPRLIPVRLETEPPIGEKINYPDYPSSDQETWQYLFKRQNSLIETRACSEYLMGQKKLQITSDKIPQLSTLSAKLHAATSWQVARIPGLLHEEDFFSLLQKKIFPSTDYIRGKDELDYTPAPDLFHDIYGHMPLITIQSFANFYQHFAKIAASAEGPNRRRLERIYWFTVEFGLIKTAQGIRVFGAGILSSPEEIEYSLTDKVEKIPFDLNIVSETEYDVWHLQEKLFVINSFDELENSFYQWVKENNLY